MPDTTPDPSLGNLVNGYRATDTTTVTAFAAMPDTPTTCGALYRLRDPAISGQRAVMFECDREPGHLGPHRERVDEFAATWAGTDEPVRRVTAEPLSQPEPLGWMVRSPHWWNHVYTDYDVAAREHAKARTTVDPNAVLAALYPAGAGPTDLHPECQAELDRDVAAERPRFLIAVRGCDICGAEPGKCHRPPCVHEAAERSGEEA